MSNHKSENETTTFTYHKLSLTHGAHLVELPLSLSSRKLAERINLLDQDDQHNS
jgi:hypothetical protein